MMGDLVEHERAVEQSRIKLSQDLAVLCSSETRAAITEDIKQQAFDLKDVFWEKLKVRAASNPAAVMAIGAGLIWRFLRDPPITSALVGVGLLSLWKTQPRTGYDAAGRRLGYLEQSREILKEQAGKAVSIAVDQAKKTTDAAAAKGSEAWQEAQETMREWSGGISTAVEEATSQLKTSAQDLMADVRDTQRGFGNQAAHSTSKKIQDPEIRNALLLGVAGAAIATAVGIACQKRFSENVN
jgi:hypothetical protein